MGDPKILAVVYGHSRLPESMVFPGGQEDVSYPICLAFYAVVTEAKVILVDAGCDTLPGLPLYGLVSPAAALKQQGIEPEQVTDVVITHAHHDHIDGIRHFPNALVHIQEAEYQSGKDYLTGHRVHRFEDACTVGPLQVVRIGGHSAGSCIALLERAGETCLFCGDECYLRPSLEGKLPPGGLRPEVSRKFVETYGNGDYRVLFCHDPEVVSGLVFPIQAGQPEVRCR